MRDFFIGWFEKLVGLIIILMSLAVLAGAAGAMFGGLGGMGGQGTSIIAGLAILVVGAIYVVFLGGLLYIGLGVYQNTKATAEAVQQLASRG